MYSKDLRNLESSNPVNNAHWVLSNLRATQKYDWKEVEEQIAEQARHLNDAEVNYQNLTNDLQRFEIIAKSAEGVIASARVMIAKAQALI